ncbi:MAG: iron ABC transporter permease, partial [Desulfobacterales bacterium]|nr:iron ABC transporter permease [Desulfobacterales bacterium]
MSTHHPFLLKRLLLVSAILMAILVLSAFLGLSMGSSGYEFKAVSKSFLSGDVFRSGSDTIIWHIRFPRVLLSILVGAALSLGGLVFQSLLRNPLAEPYILGISGGSAIGAILGILAGFSYFPGIGLFSFAGSMATLVLILVLSTGHTILKKDSLILSGVMVNAFCGAVTMFLISLTLDSRLHNVMFWLMGDLSNLDMRQVMILTGILLPCFAGIFVFSHSMNLMMLGRESAQSMGVNIKLVTLTLLAITSLMGSATVSTCGPIGFVGLVIPHLLRLVIGQDNRVLVPACILGGGAYMILCDILSRTLPRQGEIPPGVITAIIGAPL